METPHQLRACKDGRMRQEKKEGRESSSGAWAGTDRLFQKKQGRKRGTRRSWK